MANKTYIRLTENQKIICKKLGLLPVPNKPTKLDRAKFHDALARLGNTAYERGVHVGESGGYYTRRGMHAVENPVTGKSSFVFRPAEWRPSHDQAMNDLMYENEKLQATVADLEASLKRGQ